MNKLKIVFKELKGCLKWSDNTWQALRLFFSLLRFHLAEKRDRRDVTTFIRMKNPHSKICWNMHLRVFSGDLFILTEVFFDECYKLSPPPHVCKKLRILDLGGNIGLTACYFLSTFPGAEVCSVEPDAENFSLLQKNISQFPARACALHAAAGPQSGLASLRPAAAAHSITVDLHSRQGNVNILTVEGILDQLGWNQVDVVKMDIEGSEWDIFSGPLDWLQRTQLVLIEFHGERNPQELAPLFLKQGFHLHPPGTLSGQWFLKRA